MTRTAAWSVHSQTLHVTNISSSFLARDVTFAYRCRTPSPSEVTNNVATKSFVLCPFTVRRKHRPCLLNLLFLARETEQSQFFIWCSSIVQEKQPLKDTFVFNVIADGVHVLGFMSFEDNVFREVVPKLPSLEITPNFKKFKKLRQSYVAMFLSGSLLW